MKAEEKDKIEREIQEMRKKFEEEEKKHKKQATEEDKKIKELEAQLAAVQRDLREKEKENRILNFKISTQRRTIKHNQLKPVSSHFSPNALLSIFRLTGTRSLKL